MQSRVWEQNNKAANNTAGDMQKGGQAQSPACQDSFPSDFSTITAPWGPRYF